jgi:serine/threonine protein kinase
VALARRDGPDAAFTSRARGTDCFKSPEMLLVGGGAHHREQRAFDRRRRPGAGPPSDVWSLACLLYELVTGERVYWVGGVSVGLGLLSGGAGESDSWRGWRVKTP